MFNFQVSISQKISTIDQFGQVIHQVDISRANELVLSMESEIETRTSIILSDSTLLDRVILGKLLNYINQSISIGKCIVNESSNELVIEYRRALGFKGNIDSFIRVATIHYKTMKKLSKIFKL